MATLGACRAYPIFGVEWWRELHPPAVGEVPPVTVPARVRQTVALATNVLRYLVNAAHITLHTHTHTHTEATNQMHAGTSIHLGSP